jgi:endoglucanase
MIRIPRPVRGLGVLALSMLLSVVIGAIVPNSPDAGRPGWLHTSGAQIVTADGAPFTIKAISWFGLETSNCAPHGLWTIPLDDGMRQIAAMGFTTVRVPFSNECLAASGSTSIDRTANPALADLAPLELLDATVASAGAAGLSVILDRHRPDSGAQSELWYTPQYSEEQWIADWRMLAGRYRDDSTVIGVDLHNEPHGPACWGCGDPATDWRAAATRAGNAVLEVNPNLLVIVEGVERQPDGTTTWWGGGLAGVADAPVELAIPGRVVYSPHDYPASVYAQKWFAAADYPAGLEAIWERNWGYIATRGIAPVLLGEFGTTYRTDSDRQWLKSLVGYLDRTGMSFSYWSFNPNSGDTGGIVADDWRTPQQDKLDALRPILDPVPRAENPVPPIESPVPAPVPTPTQSIAPVPPRPAPAPPSGGGPTGLSAQWALQSSWGEGYVAEIVLTATASVSVWSVSWESPGATAVANSWGMDCTVQAERITCTGSAWAASLAAGQSVRVGLQVSSPSAPAAPAVTVRSS